MASNTRQLFIRYAAAFMLVGVIVFIKLLIGSFIPGQQSFLLFFAAVTLTTWYGGIGPGLVSAVLSAFFANLLFFPPDGVFSTTPTTLFQIVLFFLESLIVVGLANALRERRGLASQTLSTIPAAPQKDNAGALLDTFQVYAPVGMAFLDNDLRYIRINNAMAEANGLTPAVFIGKSMKDIQPTISQELLDKIQSVARTGTPLLDQETTITKPTLLGTRRQDFSTSYYRIRGTDGKPLGIGAVMVDITQRKEAEAALRESETRFRMMADTAPVMIWLAGADRKRTYFNKGWLDFTGRTMEEDVGSGWQANVHPDDLSKFMQQYNDAFDKQQPYRLEYRLKRYDGEYRWILATGVPRYLDDQTFDGFIGTCFDIHERRQLEIGQDFLIEAEEILAASLDYEVTLKNVAKLAVPTIADWCAVDILTAAGEIERLAVAHVDEEKVKWAYELQQRYPARLDDATGVAQVLRSGETQYVPVLTDAMLESVTSDVEVLQILREIGFTSVIITPLTARGRILGALTLVSSESRRHFDENDLTLAEQLATRAALAVDNALLFQEAQKEQERFQVTLTSVGDAVIATDTAGKVTFVNHVAEQLTGWRDEEALGKPLSDVLHVVNEKTRERVEDPVAKVLREGRTNVLTSETILISRDGREVPIEDSGAPIPGQNGEHDGVVLVFRDITERKRQEQRQAFLANASNLLISSIDYKTTLQHITQLAVPGIADAAVVYLIDEDGVTRQAAIHHADPELNRQRVEMVQKYATFSPKLAAGFQKVIQSGESELLEDVSDEVLQSAATNEEHLAMLRKLSYKSTLSVPLKSNSGTLGAFSLYTTKTTGRMLNTNDLVLAEELGRVISLALENARLYQNAQKTGSAPD